MLVSHDPADRDIAELIVDQLRGAGHLVWVDRSERGDGWAGRLLDTVWACDVVVFVASRAAQTSERVRREVHVAAAERTPVIAVLVDDVALSDDLAYYLAIVEPVDLRCNAAAGLTSLTLRVGAMPRKRVARPRRAVLRACLLLLLVVAVAACYHSVL